MKSIDRIKELWKQAGHDTRGYRARLNLARIRERKETGKRLKRTLARQETVSN